MESSAEERLLIDLSADDLFYKERFFSEDSSWVRLHNSSVGKFGHSGTEAEDHSAETAYHWPGA